MGSWTALLVAYLVGGITFVPLVLVTALVHAYFTFPRRDDVDGSDDIFQPGDDAEPFQAAKKAAAVAAAAATDSKTRAARDLDLDVAAGYFAVCREYTPMGINAKPIERSTPMGSTTVAAPSPSVYQTMYRSIFDRKSVAGPLENTSGLSQRPKKAGNVFYVVLRHGHLMLFDDEEQLEVRHVISLAHHDISIFSGGDVTPEGELFIKRNALCLSRRQNTAGQAPDSLTSKPFYLFSENCSAKEDFYFALLKNQQQTFGFDSSAPRPKQFQVKNIISLVQRLHASENHLHSRWLNAMIGRVFLSVYRTRDLENFVREKITKKIYRVKRPSFLTNITIQGIDTGEAAPFFTNVKLKDLTVEGECVVEADVKYSGNFRIQVGATAKIDLGARFKARQVNLVLAVLLRRVEGHLLFKIKAPPSNRVWFSFQTMPKMEMAIEPIVSSRQITYTVILRQIENRIKEVFAETLVQPFWDDIPFFRTEHKAWRGGIFEGDDAVPLSEVQPDKVVETSFDEPSDDKNDSNEHSRLDKSQSLPAMDMPLEKEKPGLFGRKIGRNSNSSSTSVASSGVDTKAPNSTPVPLRSPKIVRNSTEPIVGTETAHADIFKPSSSPPDHATSLMAALHCRSQDATPATTPAGSPAKAHYLPKSSRKSSTSSRDNEEGEKDSLPKHEGGSRPMTSARRNTTSSVGSGPLEEPGIDNANVPPPVSSGLSLGRNLFLRRENSGNTALAEPASGEQKRNTLAAVTNAAAQARQWGWNALQRQKDARRNGDKSHQVDLSQPMGRGQPLPPPGVPLPGPTNGKTKIGPIAMPKRKATLEQSATEAAPWVPDQEGEHRRAAQQAHPGRRVAEREQQVDDNKMLVIEAPRESQPGTPVGEGGMDFGQATAEAQDEVGKAPREAAQGPVGPSSYSSREASLLDSPIVALPAEAGHNADEEDEYGGWMEDGFLDEHQDQAGLSREGDGGGASDVGADGRDIAEAFGSASAGE
ncbi:hypothetical protein CDD82_7273 [Ophiocordyceps australis]|uniref:SMP-LTD domain-containing protein n=1 Tax=Ophiocordyceps australis TaxID=1399860 RepID=A0A2C5ZLT5_9HYPO|nr:hypothetical protein CDD82_7273 [Ophiocordyceps australis]